MHRLESAKSYPLACVSSASSAWFVLVFCFSGLVNASGVRVIRPIFPARTSFMSDANFRSVCSFLRVSREAPLGLRKFDYAKCEMQLR